ncbi:MAG: MraY family glycosyltransferase [Pseudomonadota bacterium]|nr:MraY family glycosyltransferase [Pseudomonadota bacterium]
MVNLSILFISLFITVVMVPFFRRLAYKLNALDEPDDRKIHVRPMARTGGLAMAVGALVPLVLWAPPKASLHYMLFAATIIVVAGFIDDLVGLGHWAKFGSQLLAAIVIVFYGGINIKSLGTLLPDGWLLSDWFAVPLTIIAVVGVTNAINLSDGLDGLAGGISILTFMVLGYLGFQVANPVVVMVAAAVVGAIFGFLRYNTYPATIFMGDAGSQLLGFMAIVLAIELTQKNVALSPLLPLMLLGFPILDTLTVMLARIYHGRSPFAADKNHFHHKLMRLGLYHSESVLVIYLLQLMMVLTAYSLRYCSDWLILGGSLGFAALVTLFFYLSGHFQWRLQRRELGTYGTFKKQLAELNKLTMLLKYLFRLLQVNFALVLLIIILPVDVIPGWIAGLGAGFAGLLVVSMIKQIKYYDLILRIAIYLTLPALVYLGAAHTCHSSICVWCESKIVCGAVFVSLILLSLLLLKFTRRSGYKSTPLDFLVLVVAILVPKIIPESMTGVSMGMVVVRIIAVFFAFEVVIEESRGRNRWLEIVVLAAMVCIGLKWLISS